MASLLGYHLTRCDALADDIDPYQEGIWAHGVLYPICTLDY
jgi:hypothetical protein